MYPQRDAQLFTNTISVGASVCLDVCTGSLGTEARGDFQDWGPQEHTSSAHRTGRSSWYSPTWSPIRKGTQPRTRHSRFRSSAARSWRSSVECSSPFSLTADAYSCFSCLCTISDTFCLSDRLFATYTSPCMHAVATQCEQSKPAGDCDYTDDWGASVPWCYAMMVLTASTILSFSQSPPMSSDLSSSVKCNSVWRVMLVKLALN